MKLSIYALITRHSFAEYIKEKMLIFMFRKFYTEFQDSQKIFQQWDPNISVWVSLIGLWLNDPICIKSLNILLPFPFEYHQHSHLCSIYRQAEKYKKQKNIISILNGELT